MSTGSAGRGAAGEIAKDSGLVTGVLVVKRFEMPLRRPRELFNGHDTVRAAPPPRSPAGPARRNASGVNTI